MQFDEHLCDILHGFNWTACHEVPRWWLSFLFYGARDLVEIQLGSPPTGTLLIAVLHRLLKSGNSDDLEFWLASHLAIKILLNWDVYAFSCAAVDKITTDIRGVIKKVCNLAIKY